MLINFMVDYFVFFVKINLVELILIVKEREEFRPL